MTAKTILIIAGISGLVAVALGAFGAHALKDKFGPERLITWQTGVQYQFYHTLALLAIALISLNGVSNSSNILDYSAWAFIMGIILFSGSLYALCLSGIRGIGAITPVGGLCFLVGWALLIWHAVRYLKGS